MFLYWFQKVSQFLQKYNNALKYKDFIVSSFYMIEFVINDFVKHSWVKNRIKIVILGINFKNLWTDENFLKVLRCFLVR